jgi:hypothetical protein
MTSRQETMAGRDSRRRPYSYILNGAGPFERDTPLNPQIMAKLLIARAKEKHRSKRMAQIEALEKKMKQRLAASLGLR